MNVINLHDTLITRDVYLKVRRVQIDCTWDEASQKYIITRGTGLHKGKLTRQPPLEISQGKVKRTVTEQALLEYNSLVKGYLDKGYKNIKDFGYENLDDFDPEKVLPKKKTDTKNIGKPMLCKVFNQTNKRDLETQWLASYKLDGVRMLIYCSKGEIRTASRGGGDYNIAATYILQDPYLKKLFKQNPDLVLDGELYRHGWPLNVISGLSRLETLDDRHKELKFYCYDLANTTLAFRDRLRNIVKYNKTKPEDSKVVFVEHFYAKGLDQIMQLHDKAISEGYEGLVLRTLDNYYVFGARTGEMKKVKIFKDMEAKITGLSEGLREEDMCFTLETKEGYPFKAKPIGTREEKQWYREHINEIIGQMGTIKYFGMTNTEHPVPNLPVFKAVR